jgi:hypothetical protein
MLVLTPALVWGDCLDNASAHYLRGVADWDSSQVRRAMTSLDICSQSERGYETGFLQSQCWLRLQLIAYALHQKKAVESYGKSALRILKELDRHPADTFAITVVRCFVCQLLATTGIANGARYGSQVGLLLDRLKEIRPTAYYTRLIDAVMIANRPVLVGGNPKTGRDLLQGIARDYPDSLEAKTQLATAYSLLRDYAAARRELDAVLAANPHHLLARSLRDEIGRKEKK